MDFVFVHGGGQGSWIWDETIAAMELQAPGAHRIRALDVPGCGTKRGRDTTAIAFPELIEELVGEIDGSDLRDIVLVGHSQAGTILPRLITARPDRFARVIYATCVAPVAGMTVPDTALQLHSTSESPLFQVFGNPDIPRREQSRAMFCNDMGPAQAEAFLDRLEQDRWPLSAVCWTDWSYDGLGRVPATYVQCLEDRILPPDAQEAFASRFGCDRVVRLDAGHQAQNTRPHGLGEILRREALVPA